MFAERRSARGFTIIELMVSVGLMVILIGVLAFVFQQSSRAVSGATEAVNVWQKARNLNTRMARELAAAIELTVEVGPRGGRFERAFTFGDGGWGKAQGSQDQNTNGRTIRFVSRTLNDGVLHNWDVIYEYNEYGNKGYGRIVRYKDTDREVWNDNFVDEEVVASPVRPMNDDPESVFAAGGDWQPTIEDENGAQIVNTRIPPTVRVRIILMDSHAEGTRQVPLDLYFPVYQGQ